MYVYDKKRSYGWTCSSWVIIYVAMSVCSSYGSRSWTCIKNKVELVTWQKEIFSCPFWHNNSRNIVWYSQRTAAFEWGMPCFTYWCHNFSLPVCQAYCSHYCKPLVIVSTCTFRILYFMMLNHLLPLFIAMWLKNYFKASLKPQIPRHSLILILAVHQWLQHRLCQQHTNVLCVVFASATKPELLTALP